VEPSGSTTILLNRTDSIGSGSNLTLVTLNFSFNIGSVLLLDDNSAPTTSGDFKLRIVNASPGMGAQDVYVVTDGTNINSVSPTFSSLGFGSASSYSTLVAGSYRVFFASPGSKNVSLDSGLLTLSDGQIRTLLALNNTVGGFESTVLTDAK